MTDEMRALLDRIDAMLAADGSAVRDLASIERTLTDGYAQALVLETERWRLERRMGEVTATLADGDVVDKARELSTLSRRVARADRELCRLRGLLHSLRDMRAAVLEPV